MANSGDSGNREKVVGARLYADDLLGFEEYQEDREISQSETVRRLIRAGLTADERVEQARQEERERCEERVAEIRNERKGFNLTKPSAAVLIGLGALATSLDPFTISAFGGTYGPGAVMLFWFLAAYLLQQYEQRRSEDREKDTEGE
jgi:hypothetical protein